MKDNPFSTQSDIARNMREALVTHKTLVSAYMVGVPSLTEEERHDLFTTIEALEKMMDDDGISYPYSLREVLNGATYQTAKD